MEHIFTSIDFKDNAADADVIELVNQAVSRNAQFVLVLIASQAQANIKNIPSIAAGANISVNACLLPGIIYKRDVSYNGIMVLGFAQPIVSLVIPDISEDYETLSNQLRSFVNKNGTFGSAFMFVDGLSHSIETFITTLYEQFGSDRKVIGAGAGNKDFESVPCLANEQGCYQNAAIIFCLSNDHQIQTVGKHGLESVAGPFLVTKARNNVIYGLNYQPAFEIFSAAIKANFSGYTNTDIQQQLHCFPFGLKQLDNEYLVRDIVGVEEETLVCVGNVAENSLVYILHTDKEKMISAASKASPELLPKLTHPTPKSLRLICLIDCISRALYLQDDYHLELDALNDNLPENLATAGILSIGEIKNSSQGAIQFLNKTIVLGGM